MSSSFLDPPLTPRNGYKLYVLIVARISGDNQDEKSLADQEAMIRGWLKQHYGGRLAVKVIATRGSGERLDRKELRKMRKLIASKKVDLVISEDLGRIARRVQAFEICELCQDFDTRLIAINDSIDTSREDWQMHSFFATMRHESYNRDTGKRIRRTLRNRFAQGGVVQTLMFGYFKPPGAKSDADVQKIAEYQPVIEGIFERLENDWTYSEVSDWLNENNVPTGKWCRRDRWDCKMVGRLVVNPLLKGTRVRNRKISRRVNRTGRHKSINAPAEELLERKCPHLAYINPERYDRLIAKLTAKNACFSVTKKHSVDPRLGRSRKKSAWPGQHVTCGICGHFYVHGGHGSNKHLMCSGAKDYKCWNGVTIEGASTATKVAAAVVHAIMALPDFDEEFRRTVEELAAEQGSKQTAELMAASSKLAQCQRKLDKFMDAIAESGGMQSMYVQIRQLEIERARWVAQLSELEQEPPQLVNVPPIEDLRRLAIESFDQLSHNSHEFAKLMKRLAKTIAVFPYRAIDGGHVVLRAVFRVSLAPLVPQLRKLPIDDRLISNEIIVSLYEEPQRLAHREQIVKLINEGTFQRETGKALGITQPAVQRALKLNELMLAAGITDPYIRVLEPPDDYNKLRRHRHRRYRFEPKLPPDP